MNVPDEHAPSLINPPHPRDGAGRITEQPSPSPFALSERAVNANLNGDAHYG
jgi:hypothetical protein